MNGSSHCQVTNPLDTAEHYQKPSNHWTKTVGERKFTSSYGSLTRAKLAINESHMKIKKITCLGSGFVGGKWQGNHDLSLQV